MPRLEREDGADPADDLRAAWDDASALSRQIAKAVSDGRAGQVEAASVRVLELSPDSETAVCLRAVVLMQLRKPRIVEAVDLLSTFAREHRETPSVLVTLAKAHELGGDPHERNQMLRRALDIDPNHKRALTWATSLKRESGGEEAYVETLHQLANQTGAWRPQLLLATHFLESGQIDLALERSNCALAKVDEDPNVLSATLDTFWRSEHLGEVVAQLAAVYDLERHGDAFGSRLAKAMATVGRGRDAQAWVRKLRDRAFQRGEDIPEHHQSPPSAAPRAPPEAQPSAGRAATPGSHQVRVVSVAAPIWTRGLDEPTWLLPKRAHETPRLVFSVFNIQDRGDSPPASAVRRSALALPLYLSDACRFVSRLPTVVLIPWEVGQGPIVSQAPSPRESLLAATPSPTEHDISVTGSVRSDGHNHHLELDIFHSASMKLVCSEHLDARSAGELAARAEDCMLTALESLGGQTEVSGTLYSRPPPAVMDTYLASLDLLLTQSGIAVGILPPRTPEEDNATLAYYAHLIELWPDAPQAKVAMLAGVLLAMRCGSPVDPAHVERIQSWMAEASGPEDPLARLRPVLLLKTGDGAGFQKAFDELSVGARGAYASWLTDVAAAGKYAKRR